MEVLREGVLILIRCYVGESISADLTSEPDSEIVNRLQYIFQHYAALSNAADQIKKVQERYLEDLI